MGMVLPKIHILLICFLIAMRIIFRPRIFACKKPTNISVCGLSLIYTISRFRMHNSFIFSIAKKVSDGLFIPLFKQRYKSSHGQP